MVYETQLEANFLSLSGLHWVLCISTFSSILEVSMVYAGFLPFYIQVHFSFSITGATGEYYPHTPSSMSKISK